MATGTPLPLGRGVLGESRPGDQTIPPTALASRKAIMQLTYTITPTKYSYNVPLTYTIQSANTAPLLLYYLIAPQSAFAINGEVLSVAPDRVNYTLSPVAARTLIGMPILQGRRTVTFTYSVLQWPELQQLANFYDPLSTQVLLTYPDETGSWTQMMATMHPPNFGSMSNMVVQNVTFTFTLLPNIFQKLPTVSTSGSTGSSSGSTGSSGGSSGSSGNSIFKIGSVPFHGVYVFNGNNGSTLATNSSIAGTYLGYSWAELEPTQGQYNWSQIDNDMAPWIAQGKNVIIRVSTSGWASWAPVLSKSWTPSWVYGLGSGVEYITEDDGAIKPQYWNPTFLNALNSFVTAFGKQYDGNANIVCIEIGIGDGGETKVDTRNNPNRLSMWQKIGYTDAVWWDTIQKICGFYQSAFTHTPLALMPDATFIGGTSGYNESKVLTYAVQQKLWLQNNGLVAGQSINTLFNQVPMIISEQRNPTSISGDTLQEDIQLALDAGAGYFMGFLEDLQKSTNQTVLTQAAALVTTS